jgi:hypothetical protein
VECPLNKAKKKGIDIIIIDDEKPEETIRATNQKPNSGQKATKKNKKGKRKG